jgi:D-3-phosphoglycerate dehydrogenase
MTRKIVQLNLLPVKPEITREYMREIDGEVVVANCKTEDEVIEVARDADAIIRAGGPLNRRVLESLRKCQIISCYAIDIDGIDLGAATEKGICISYAIDASTEEVSDHGMAMMLAMARKLIPYDRFVKSGWLVDDYNYVVDMGRPLIRMKEATVGSIGMGRAARALARKTSGFGMRFLAYDPTLGGKTALEPGVELTSLERVLGESDFVHMNVPQTKDTFHLIGLEQLKMMKRTAFIINSTARASIIDETALYKALSEGWIAGAALDILEGKPVVDNPLIKLDNVILTPHVCHISDASYRDLEERVCEDVVHFFQGQWPVLLANPKIKETVHLKSQIE